MPRENEVDFINAMTKIDNELQPTFTIQVILDGDDDAEKQTENVADALSQSIHNMQYEGLIRSGTVHRDRT